MEVTDPHDAQIVEVAVEVSAGKCRQVGTKYCGGAACGFSDGVDGANDAKERAASMKKLWISVILCIIFMAIEVIGGIKANSLAIMTDALHLLSDVAAFGISLFSLWAAGWEANSRQSYGFFRIEILGTLVSIQLIWLLTGIVVYEAIDRMINDTGYVEGLLMFVVAAFGLVVNVIMALLLGHDHGHGHSHGHGDAHDHFHEREHGPSGRNKHAGSEPHHVHHDHGDKHQGEGHRHEKVRSEQHLEHEQGSITVLSDNDLLKQPLISHFEDGCTGESAAKGKPKRRNINVQGAYLHVLGDLVQSIGVMVGGGIIWWKSEWRIIDLLCTFFFSLIVLATTIKMLRNILEVLMESTPREIDARKLEQGLCEMQEVEAIHELHIWAITVGKILLACHVKIKPEADADLVLDKVISYIQREYKISHVTIQIER